MEFGYWDKTIEVWHEQGLPAYLKTNEDIQRHFGLEGISIIPEIPVKNGLFPPFEEKVLEEKGEQRIIQNKEGIRE